MADPLICSAPGCDKLAYTKRTGLCGMHASRLKRGGTLDRRVEKATFDDLLGTRQFGDWTALSEASPYIRPDNGAEMRMALCRCVCGTERAVAIHTLKLGTSKHCGCKVSALITEMKTTHGMRDTAEYRSWCHLRERCTKPDCADWPNYGGRGITVCDRWMLSFESFYADMGPKPSAAHSIDRIDNDGNYEPSNCRWATPKEQRANQRPRR